MMSDPGKDSGHWVIQGGRRSKVVPLLTDLLAGSWMFKICCKMQGSGEKFQRGIDSEVVNL